MHFDYRKHYFLSIKHYYLYQNGFHMAGVFIIIMYLLTAIIKYLSS